MTGFRYDFKTKVSLLITQGTLAIRHDITKLLIVCHYSVIGTFGLQRPGNETGETGNQRKN